MKKQRPVNLDLTTIKMHPAANASILAPYFRCYYGFCYWYFVVDTITITYLLRKGLLKLKLCLTALFFKLIIITGILAAINLPLTSRWYVTFLMDLGHFEEKGFW